MNYSDAEISTSRREDEPLVEAAVQLLPVLAKAFFSAITSLGNAYGLTPAQVKVLLHLGTHRQMTVGEIAAALPCSMPAASELVDRLVDAGHLVRASDPSDRRRVLVAATPDSERISSHLREIREAQVRHALNQLSPNDRPTFIRSLQALIAGLTHAEGTLETEYQSTAAPCSDSSPVVASEHSASAPPDLTLEQHHPARDTAGARSLQGTAR
jgi:DNA-binding MarR family transcriptional regulator